MEIARLVLDFCKVLIWPLATLAIAYGFRHEVKGLVKRVRNLSAAGVDAEFSEEVEETSANAEAAVRRSPTAGHSQDEDDPQGEVEAPPTQLEVGEAVTNPLVAMAFVSPDGAMMAAWRTVEMQLAKMLPEWQEDRRRPQLVSYLAKNQYLPHEVSHALLDMRRVRNEVTHVKERSPGPEAAAEYVASCDKMVKWLESYRQSGAWEDARQKLRMVMEHDATWQRGFRRPTDGPEGTKARS
ncbi:hypothetical protein OG944_10095 [Streptomyces anulatus]|uniref:hypothetical protein n=1 Tax=Streptomyces anulatus TaxID=1892 RepID=UPI00386DD3D9